VTRHIFIANHMATMGGASGTSLTTAGVTPKATFAMSLDACVSQAC